MNDTYTVCSGNDKMERRVVVDHVVLQPNTQPQQMEYMGIKDLKLCEAIKETPLRPLVELYTTFNCLRKKMNGKGI